MLGTVVLAGLLVLSAAGAGNADSLQVLHNFTGTDGSSPTGLIQASDGNFYGAGANGGDLNTCSPDGCGTLFKMDTAGNFKLLHVFIASDGLYPTGLVEGSNGRFYGTTEAGGAGSGGGSGVIFSLTPKGKFTVLYRFVGGFSCCDGADPRGHMLLASDGKFYGTTASGGEFRDVDHQGGFDPVTNAVTILHSFNIQDANGIYPNGPLIQANDGFLYGTTRETENGGQGGGTLFRIDTNGNLSLVAALPGTEPLSGVIQAGDGNFYGTDDGGGGLGSLYRVDTAGNVTMLNRFDGADGRGPRYQFTQAGDEKFYGTALEGGLLDAQGGDVFRLTATGKLRVLHSFASAEAGGILPNAQLVQGNDGALYGTAGLGGSNNRGTIFRLDPLDLGPVALVSVKPDVIVSGKRAVGKVRLFNPAPQGGTVVTLGAQQGQIVIPPSVKVKAGDTIAKFKIDTMKIGAEATVRIYAYVAGQGTRTTVTVTP
jgi:uncharacterized repeat protein (TIGR03803 family)